MGRGAKHSSRVLYISSLGFHLLSVYEVRKTGKRVEFDDHSVAIRDVTISQSRMEW